MTLNFKLIANLSRQKLSDSDFRRLGGLIEKEYGIKMPPCKRQMLESRLRKRLKLLGFANFGEYCKFLFTDEGMKDELVHMLDMVTTNKTDFFREPEHFDYLVNNVLPDMISIHGAGVNRDLMLWSAGSSTGEEAYTLCMMLKEFQEKRAPGIQLRFTVLGTDLSTRVLEAASRAIYTEEKAEQIPRALLRKYVMKSKDPSKRLIRIIPELRNHVKFRRLNFLEGDFGLREPMDIVFFRNVMIYFKRDIQRMILNKIAPCIRPGGYLFIGHSETLSGLGLPMQQMAPTIYRKPR